MAPSQPLPEQPAGLIGGRFLVEGALGRGGMAAVYRVRDVKTGEKLALKRSWAKDAQHANKRRMLLEREFHTLAQLRHPRIIEVYDYGSDEAGPYYTMELLDGADLDQAGALPWQEAAALLRDIASSLAILHSRGLIHRDVSARNVRRTADGRAKLIDFGAMVSMGTASDVVGTPPFMAPEVLQMQALDARADLFSLGALAYYLLTGRHAYPARRSSELRDTWRSRPQPPSRLLPAIPTPLSTMVLQLLSLDRGARPQHAAEIMERLCAIAALPTEELPEISRAYLTTPTLVGRDKTLLAIRGHMLSLVRGDGGALLLEGSAGSGRSRMIDACVFEGKLLTAIVLRADAGDATAPWGVARTITSQLFGMLPELALEATRLSQGVLAQVIDEVRRDGGHSMSVYSPERSLILRELRDFVLAMARGHRLLIVIDDADRIDEPSAAWLSALADKSEHQGIMLMLAVEPPRADSRSDSLSLYRSLAHRVTLPPLDAEQTEALMRSVFGEVGNLGLWAGHIHSLAHGSPRATMELAQTLVDRRLARYEAGSWLLPPNLEAIELPRTLADSLAGRLDTLGPDALELAEALSIADPLALALSSYRSLTRHRDQKRLFAALEELVSARVLIAGQERYRFSQRGFQSVLIARMAEPRKRSIHARVAELLAATGGEATPRAHHLMQAGREAEAIQLLCASDLMVKLPPIRLLERAVAYAERDGKLGARALHRLRMALLTKASLVGAVEVFRRYLTPVLKQLEFDSGLLVYRELGDAPAESRLTQALNRQQQRYLATPEHEQVYGAGDALRELGRLIGVVCSMAATTFDLQMIEVLPSLAPFLPLSPALRVVDLLRQASILWLSGRSDQACTAYEQALARLAEPDRAGLDEVHHGRARAGIEYVLALNEALVANDRAEERAQFLESHRALRVNAWRVRMLFHLARGDAHAAQKCARRADLLMLQDEAETHYPGTAIGFQLGACYAAEDLLGVKAAVDALGLVSETQPGWRPMLIYGQSAYRLLQGDLVGALDVLTAGFELAKPSRHMVFGLLAAQRVKVLHALGRIDEALQHAEHDLAIIESEQLSTSRRLMHSTVARVLADAGRHAEAVAMMDDTIAEVEAARSTGLTLGMQFESRARIAVAMRDPIVFQAAAERCGAEFKKGKNPLLTAKLARLIEHARFHGIAPSAHLDALLISELEPLGMDGDDDSTVVTRLLECTDKHDRARCALTMVLQCTDSYLGHLFGVKDNELEWLAGLPESAVEPALVEWLWASVEAERDAAITGGASTTTVSGNPPSPDAQPLHSGTQSTEGDRSVSPVYVDTEARTFRVVFLYDNRKVQRRLVGVLAIQVQSDQRMRPPLGLLSQLAGQLLDHGDAPGIALDAVAVTVPE